MPTEVADGARIAGGWNASWQSRDSSTPIDSEQTQRPHVTLPLPVWTALIGFAVLTCFAAVLYAVFHGQGRATLEQMADEAHREWAGAGEAAASAQVVAATSVINSTYAAGKELAMGSLELRQALLAAGLSADNRLLPFQLVGVADTDGGYTGVGITTAGGQIGVASAGEQETLDFVPWDGGVTTSLPDWRVTDRAWFQAGLVAAERSQFVGPLMGLDGNMQYSTVLGEPGSGRVWMGSIPVSTMAQLVQDAWTPAGRYNAALVIVHPEGGPTTDRPTPSEPVETVWASNNAPTELIEEAAANLGSRVSRTSTATSPDGDHWFVTVGRLLPGNNTAVWALASPAEPGTDLSTDRYLLTAITAGVLLLFAAVLCSLGPARRLRRLADKIRGATEQHFTSRVTELVAIRDAYRTTRERHERDLCTARAHSQNLVRLHVRTTEAHEGELRRIAAFVHDGPLQSAIAARMWIRDDSAHVVAPLEQCRDELRDLTTALSGDEFGPGGLPRKLSELAAEMSATPGFDVTVETPEVSNVHPTVGRVLVRAARELLHNSRKHSGSPTATLHLAVTPQMVRLTVTDEGVGFANTLGENDTAGAGFGLLSLRVQLEELGGTVDINDTAAGGAAVVVSVPPHPTPERSFS